MHVLKILLFHFCYIMAGQLLGMKFHIWSIETMFGKFVYWLSEALKWGVCQYDYQ